MKLVVRLATLGARALSNDRGHVWYVAKLRGEANYATAIFLGRSGECVPVEKAIIVGESFPGAADGLDDRFEPVLVDIALERAMQAIRDAIAVMEA